MATRKRPVAPRRNPGWCHMEAHSSNDDVILERNMSDENALGVTWDPFVTLEIRTPHSLIHPEDSFSAAPYEYIERIRASQLDLLVEQITEAIDAARRDGMIPPALTDAEWNARWAAANPALTRGGAHGRP